MPKSVEFADDIVASAAEAAPSFKFSKFAQAAVREKIDREKLMREKLVGAHHA